MKQPCLYSAEVADGTCVKPFDVRPLFNDNALQKNQDYANIIHLEIIKVSLAFQ